MRVHVHDELAGELLRALVGGFGRGRLDRDTLKSGP
jgi:hypothetical protein